MAQFLKGFLEILKKYVLIIGRGSQANNTTMYPYMSEKKTQKRKWHQDG